jgi:hypothetical protein
MKRTHLLTQTVIGVAAAWMSASPAHASLIDHGVTYTLTESTTADPLVNLFTLSITGINGPDDTEGGRFGVESFAFNQPTGFISATGPAGFTTYSGGLNASGCSGSGNFFCFSADSPIIGPALAAGSSLSFDFSITATSFLNYVPDFKINWEGTQNNYDLVSKPLAPQPGDTPPTSVPEPTSLWLSAVSLLGFAFWARRRKSVVS